MDGFEVFRQLQAKFPPENSLISIDMNNKNPQFLGMHIAIEKSKAILYLLRKAGVFDNIPKQK